MTMLTLLTVGCCCGCPAYFGKPIWDQYPAKVALPGQVADLSLRQNASSIRTAQQLKQDMRTAHLLAENTFAGVYTDPNGKAVTIFGATGLQLSPDKDLDAEITRLTGTYQLTEVQSVNTNTPGEYQRCATGQANGTPVVLCAWADHGSIASALFTRRSMNDSAQLLSDLRNTIVTRG
jgi:hypothetical protein